VQKKKNPIPDGLDTQHASEEKKNPQNTVEIHFRGLAKDGRIKTYVTQLDSERSPG
jgi:hypothetical protein